MLEMILLDDPARSKLGIYKHMLEIDPGEYPIHYFEKHTGYSHIKTANLLNGMREDLLAIKKDCQLMTPREKIQIAKEMPTYQTYQQYLLARSVPYQALVQTLLEPDKDLKYFGGKTELSQSSLMRRLKPLVDYLKTKKIRFNCLQMQVTGRESSIRIMYFNFLWMVNFGTELYDYFRDEYAIELDDFMTREEMDYLRYVEKREFSLYRGISFLRTRLGHYIDEPEINSFIYPLNVSKAFKAELDRQGVPETYQEREANFVSYIVFYWPQVFALDDPRLPIIRKNYKRLADVSEKASAFFEKIEGSIHQMSKQQRELMLINCESIFLRNQLFSDTAPQNLDFVFSNLQEQHPNYTVLEGYVEKALSGTETNENTVRLLTLVLLPHFERKDEIENVRVGIIGFPNHFLLYSMMHRIEELPFVDYSLMNTNSKEHFDAVITCSTKLLPENVDDYWVVEGEGSFDAMDDYLFKLFKRKARQSNQ